MRNLINFLIQNGVFILFLFLEIISFSLVVNNQKYQRSVFLTSSNIVISELYQINNSVTDFFNLKSENEKLAQENTKLHNEIIILRNQNSEAQPATKNLVAFNIPTEAKYKLISAKVINSSTNKLQNYITLNKGSLDGVKVDMGVINDDGVIGIIKNVSKKFSVAIPILNSKLEISCKFKKNNFSGALAWPGIDYRFANLQDIPRHVEFSLGDSLLTSGYASNFPAGIPVGTIENFSINKSEQYYKIKVKLCVNFRTLDHVEIINYINYDQQKELEKEAEE